MASRTCVNWGNQGTDTHRGTTMGEHGKIWPAQASEGTSGDSRLPASPSLTLPSSGEKPSVLFALPVFVAWLSQLGLSWMELV